jgi:hypothetical protein
MDIKGLRACALAFVWLLSSSLLRAEGQTGNLVPVKSQEAPEGLASVAGTLTIGQILIIVDRNEVETRGLLSSATTTSLRLTVNGRDREFPAEAIRAIYGESRGTGRGAWIGLGAGVGVATALGALMDASGSGFLRGTAFFGGIGAGLGALVGSAFKHRQRIYDVDTRVDVAVRSPAGRHAVAAQPTPPNLALPRPDRKWEASFVIGPTSSGPAGDFERAMRAARFDESRGTCILGLCFPGSPHPSSHTGFGDPEWYPWHVNVQRRLSPWYGVGFVGGHAGIGYTVGQKRDTGDYLSVSYGVTTLAPVFVVGPARGFHAAAGPAFYSVTNRGSSSSSPQDARQSDSDRKIGLVTRLGLAVPARSRVFGEVLVEYRLLGEIEAGPFSTDGSLSRVVSTLPATSVRMNHWFIGVGAGVRF